MPSPTPARRSPPGPAASLGAAPPGGAWLAPLAVALIWGVNVPVMKAAIGVLDPFLFNALRLTLSVLVLGLVEHRPRRAVPRGPTPWGAVALIAVTTSVGYQALFISGMARTSAGHTGFLIASGPMWTALIARAAGVERVSGRAWGGLVLAFVGTALVVAAARGGDATLLGNLLVLAAMISWAAGTVRSRSVLERVSGTRLAYLAGLISLPGHWLLALPHLSLAWEETSPLLWAGVVYSGAMSTGLAYVLWNRSVLRIGPARTSAFTNLVPLVAVALAWATLGERPTALQVGGGALVLLGIASWRARRAR